MIQKLAFLGLLVTYFGFVSVSYGQIASIRPAENLIVDGIPEIPAAIADDVRRYTESRSAGFASWHPQRREMLISTRFGNTAQIHELKLPGGARKQLTFFNEPIGGADWEPKKGDYFLFSKDTGGNEFGQIYRFDIVSGNFTMLTDGGRSQNGGWEWNRAKNKIVYSSTRRNGADRDLWTMNPNDKSSDRMLIELTGGGWGADDWSPDDSKIVAIERISVNKSNLWIIDVAKGTKIQLNKDTDVAYGGAKFSADGRGLYVTTDNDAEFQQLAYWDLASNKLDVLTGQIPWDVEAFDVSKDGQMIVFVTNEAGVSKAWLLETETKKITPIAGLPSGIVSGGAWNESGSEIAFSISSAR